MNPVIIGHMYTEWLEKNCKDSLTHTELNVHMPNMHENLETVVKKDGTAFVIYGKGEYAPSDEVYHVALLISRKAHGVEYVDCMANPLNESQVMFENKCREMCRSCGKSFVGTNELFSYSKTAREYAHFPPQTAEQQFIGLYQHHPEYFYKEIEQFPLAEQERMILFAERYAHHDGGDCIFWAFHVATQMVELNLPARGWFQRQSWFVESDIMKQVPKCNVTNEIFASLLRCQKRILKNVPR